MMKHRQLAGWIAALCMAATTGCGSAAEENGQTAGTPIRASAAASAAAEEPANAPAVDARPAKKPPKPKKKNPTLPGQFAMHLGGGAHDADCFDDLSGLPPAFSTSPAVWMSDSRGPRKFVFVVDSALCLHGFSADRPITVTISDGVRRYTTPVQPTAGTFSLKFKPAESLFNGAPLRVYDVGKGVMQSDSWPFVPPSPVRENIAKAGHITISASQAGVNASYRQAVGVPEYPGRDRLLGDNKRRLVVYSFDQGQRIPIGLYRKDRQNHAKLVRQLGTVVMPRSRTAVFTVPRSAAGASYCVTVPLKVQLNCPSF
jgi:hypothetical protein